MVSETFRYVIELCEMYDDFHHLSLYHGNEEGKNEYNGCYFWLSPIKVLIDARYFCEKRKENEG